MSRTVLIVMGVLILTLLILVIVGRTPNIKNSISRMNGGAALLLILLMVAALAFIAVKVFLPNGPESVFLESEGDREGKAETDQSVEETEKQTEKETGTGFGLSEATSGNMEGDTTVYVTVAGNGVRIGEVPFMDMTDFSEAAAGLKKEGAQFCLVDDYALADTYNQAADILTKNGIRYAEKEIN